MRGREGGTFANKRAKFGHFCQNHRNNFESVNFICGELTGLFRLNHKYAKNIPDTLNWHTTEG